jgi:hypothetical protein
MDVFEWLDGVDVFAATKAIAAAAVTSIPAPAMRTSERKRFRLNQ